MTLHELLGHFDFGIIAGEGFVALVLLSLIQVSPLKVNPWDRILGWFGRKINKQTDDDIRELKKQISDMWVNGHRSTILTFAREAREGIRHSPDEWTNALNQAEEYEKFVHDHGITNGIVTQDTEYIRRLYQEKSREKRI